LQEADQSSIIIKNPAERLSAQPERRNVKVWLLLLAVLLTLGLSLFIGRYPRPFLMPPELLWQDELALKLVLNLRLPRILSAFLLGASLSSAGMVMQMLFRNPLVEPGFLGVSQGAAFGAALSIVFLSSNQLGIAANATLFAFIGLLLTYFLARYLRYGGWVLRLVLAGIAVSALFSSGVGVLKYLADPTDQLQEIVFWLLGGLWSITWRDLAFIAGPVLIGLLVIYLMRWRLNLLSLNDETAFSLGVSVGRERALLLGAAVMVTAAVVSVAGIVGWVGLIIPHIARRISGANAAQAVPTAIFLGGIFGVLSDNIARTVMAGEIPLGILTSLFGAAIFAGLMVTYNLKVKQ
jgi:iron complex transport system permease protein